MVTMLVLFWIRYRGYTRHHEKVIRAPLIVPILFFLACAGLVGDQSLPHRPALQTLTTLIKETSCAIISIVVLGASGILYLICLYEKALPSVRLYRDTTRRVDREPEGVLLRERPLQTRSPPFSKCSST